MADFGGAYESLRVEDERALHAVTASYGPIMRKDGVVAEWTFLTHHAHVLLAVAHDSDASVKDIAEVVGISTRSAVTILNDLEAAGYLEREKRGRRNHYILHPERPLRHPSNAGHTIDDLIQALLDVR